MAHDIHDGNTWYKFLLQIDNYSLFINGGYSYIALNNIYKKNDVCYIYDISGYNIINAKNVNMYAVNNIYKKTLI